jgi:hypothetical protein
MNDANVKKSNKKRIVITVCLALVGAILLTAIGYVIYVFAAYDRIDDNADLSILNGNDTAAPVGEELKIITYNIGFAAYTPEYSFFMDGGEYSRAVSEESVHSVMADIALLLKSENADFLMLEEVDEMKYKVGDKVRVRDDLEVGQVYGDCEFIMEMKGFSGKIMTIEKAYCSSYRLHGGGTWHFTDEMLEDVESGVMMIKIYQDGNKVIAKKEGKFGVARCSPDDKFDFFTGAKLALDRLEEKCKPYAWLKDRMTYYYPAPYRDILCNYEMYQNTEFDKRMISRGLVYKTKEEAIEAAEKMLAVLKEDDDAS